MLQRLQNARDEKGFTLIELLIVIVILGILAAVVVFAVGGITDRGQSSACSTDQRAVRTAAENYFAKNSTYGNETALKAGGLLSTVSTLTNVTVGADTAAATAATNSEGASATGAAYVLKYQDVKCGTVGAVIP